MYLICTLTITLIFISIAVAYAYHRYSYWSLRGVRGPRSIFPFGYLLYKALYRPHDIERKWASEFGANKMYGVYTGLAPTLTVLDPELIRHILVRDFACFTNRRHMNSYNVFWNGNLFMETDARWRRLRSICSPSFSCGKLKSMVPLMARCIDKLVDYFDSTLAERDGVFTAKDAFAGYTVDTILSVAFATETNANLNANPLVENGKRFFQLNPLKILTILVLPRKMLNWLGVTQPFKGETFDYFVDFAKEVLAKRKEELTQGKPNRNDLIQLLLDATLGEESSETEPNASKLSETEIIAQCIIFLAAGYETSAATITHCAFELARNPLIQERLFTELAKAKDDVSILHHSPYLEAVIKETLRKYPPVVRLERRVGVDGYQLGGLSLEKGTLLEIPPSALHYCPEYFPEPDTFNPDRFMPENRDQLVPYTYLPFGDGPRNCIGARFAMYEMQLCLAALVRRYKLLTTEGTPEVLQFLRGIPMLNAQPFTLKLTRRE